MKYNEFEKEIEEWGRIYNYKPIVRIEPEYIILKNNDYIICMIYKLERFVSDFNWVAYRHLSENAKEELFKIVTEFAATPPENREDEEENIDSIINRLKEVQTNAEGVMSWEDIAIKWTDLASWTDVVSWMGEEIEKNRELINTLKDIIIDLEEYKEAN